MDWDALVALLCLIVASPVLFQIGRFVYRLFRVLDRKLAAWEERDLDR